MGYLAREQEIRDYVQKNPEKLRYKKPLQVAAPKADAALTKWVLERLRRGVRLTGDLIREKAHAFCIYFPLLLAKKSISQTVGLTASRSVLVCVLVWYHGQAASAPIDQVPPEYGRLQ